MTIATWRDLAGERYGEISDEIPMHRCSAGVEGPWILFDEGVSRNLIARCRELGGAGFRLSHDLAAMLLSGRFDDPDVSMPANRWDVLCDHSLPPNSVVRLDATGGES